MRFLAVCLLWSALWLVFLVNWPETQIARAVIAICAGFYAWSLGRPCKSLMQVSAFFIGIAVYALVGALFPAYYR